MCAYRFPPGTLPAESNPVLGRSHVILASATWAAVWWRPLAINDLQLVAPLAALPAVIETLPDLPSPLVPDEIPDLPLVLVTLAIVGLGALLPDLDHPRGRLASWRPIPSRGHLRWFSWIRPLLLPSMAIREQFGHRGALHSLLAALIAGFGAESLAQLANAPGTGAALAWGYVAHLLADMATRRGVPLLYPLPWRFRLPGPLAIRTGRLGEVLYVFLISAVAALYALG